MKILSSYKNTEESIFENICLLKVAADELHGPLLVAQLPVEAASVQEMVVPAVHVAARRGVGRGRGAVSSRRHRATAHVRLKSAGEVIRVAEEAGAGEVAVREVSKILAFDLFRVL